jgi:RNA polymerase sigma-70 factor (ECF subfamily)
VSDSPCKEATRVLAQLQRGDSAAAAELLPLVYEQLRQVADAYFRKQPSDHTLQPTALVHEAYVRLIAHKSQSWTSRAHFFAVAAKAMRQVLVNHAQRRRAQRRGGGRRKLTLHDAMCPAAQSDLDVLILDEALERLSALNERMASVVELRFFAGMPMDQVAEALNVSKRTVEGDWATARAWLARELSEDHAP